VVEQIKNQIKEGGKIMTILQWDGNHYGIWADRSADSVFGKASRWAKHGGERLAFKSKEEAQAVADHFNTTIRTANVRYSVKKI